MSDISEDIIETAERMWADCSEVGIRSPATVIARALMAERERTRTVWVALPYYAYEGYGEPERVFMAKELAEAWKASEPHHRDMEIFELPLLEGRTP